MKKADFLQEVQQEIEHIKKKAKKSELKKLNFKTFCYHSRIECIYGQMTGNCDSVRANELMPKTYFDVYRGLNGFGDRPKQFSKQTFKKEAVLQP